MGLRHTKEARAAVAEVEQQHQINGTAKPALNGSAKKDSKCNDNCKCNPCNCNPCKCNDNTEKPQANGTPSKAPEEIINESPKKSEEPTPVGESPKADDGEKHNALCKCNPCTCNPCKCGQEPDNEKAAEDKPEEQKDQPEVESPKKDIKPVEETNLDEVETPKVEEPIVEEPSHDDKKPEAESEDRVGESGDILPTETQVEEHH